MSDSVAEFRAHRNYIRAFAAICGHIDGRPYQRVWEDLQTLAESSDTVRVSPQAPVDGARVSRSLANAWGTEYLLATNYRFAKEDEIVRITNTWAIVQTYYVHYHSFQALLAARARQRPESHSKTQALFADAWAGRRVLIPPCSYGVNSDGPVNTPPGVSINLSIHPWSGCDKESCWSLAGLALRTTRDEAVKERKKANRIGKQKRRRDEWAREEEERVKKGRRARKRPAFALPLLSEAEHTKIERSVRVHTLMDYLYRLRLKANYVDATMFTDGPEDEYVSRTLLQDLKDLAANTLLVHEIHIREAIGRPAFSEMLESWLSGVVGGPRVGVAERRPLLVE